MTTTTIPEGYYFRSRPGPTEPVDWTKRVDPDGKVRVRAEERELAVRDTREAVAFLAHRCRSVFDFGCGFGFTSSALQDAGSIVSASEPDKHSRDFARALGVIVIDADCYYKDRWFCGVLSWNVLEHVAPDAEFMDNARGPLGYLREAARVTIVGGWLVLQTPNFESEAAREWGERYRMLHDPTHVSLFGETGLRRALRDTGWIVREMRHDYLRTRFNTPENNARLAAVGEGVSPSAIGNVMTAYCQRADERQAALMLAMGELERGIG